MAWKLLRKMFGEPERVSTQWETKQEQRRQKHQRSRMSNLKWAYLPFMRNWRPQGRLTSISRRIPFVHRLLKRFKNNPKRILLFVLAAANGLQRRSHLPPNTPADTPASSTRYVVMVHTVPGVVDDWPWSHSTPLHNNETASPPKSQNTSTSN